MSVVDRLRVKASSRPVAGRRADAGRTLVAVRMTTTIEQSVMHLSSGHEDPGWLAAWWMRFPGDRLVTQDPEVVLTAALKERPRLIIIDGRQGDPEAGVARTGVHESAPWTRTAISVCERLKRDAYTGIVPVLVVVPPQAFFMAFEAGADEVLRSDVGEAEALVRLSAMLRRSDRDTDVHPSTRLPGAREIEAELIRRVRSGEKFAACYADLDHFKEFNDRYGYHHGDRVIRLLARILHDVVKGLCGGDGFVGHIGGDDFLFTIPLASVTRVCDEIVQIFDELIPWQYSEQDRRIGYFLGKDRRGQLHRVPLMTLSVGVVTNQRRHFTRATEVSELATEMKSYAKTLPGSVWAVDRRRDEITPVRGANAASGSMDEGRSAAGAS